MSGPDVVGIGNALVDVLATVDDAVLDQQGLIKGVMRLCDADEADRIYEAMGPGVEKSGGSVANTMVGIASFGGAAGFIGKVRDDQLGQVFAHDIRAAGVEFSCAPATDGPPTGRCLVLITPDAQRTLNTSLGIAGLVGPDDVSQDVVASAAITMVEGFLWEEPSAKSAVLRAISIAHRVGQRIALSLSDPFCVDRNRAEFLELVERDVDILFANEAELLSLYEMLNLDEAIERVRGVVEIGAITLGAEGSIIVAGERTERIAAEPATVVDTTGAGDLYAAGVLFGITQGHDLAVAGRLGSVAAAEVISYVGARPQTSLADLAKQVL